MRTVIAEPMESGNHVKSDPARIGFVRTDPVKTDHVGTVRTDHVKSCLGRIDSVRTYSIKLTLLYQIL